MKIVAIIQARVGSSRLPGKVLKPIEGRSMLARVVERVHRSRHVSDVLVATTDLAVDDAIVAECEKCAVQVSRGDQDDVLDRYHRAAQLAEADVVVRITSDCPLIDPEITDRTVESFLEFSPDYASNALERTYPRGLDTEVISFQALTRAWRTAHKSYEREHVTPYIYEHPEEFKLISVKANRDYSFHRWTVDTPEDLEFIRAVYGHLNQAGCFSWRDVLELLERQPELIGLNSSVMQKTLKGT